MLLETNDTRTGRFRQVAMDAQGNAMVVWAQYDGARYLNVWSNQLR